MAEFESEAGCLQQYRRLDGSVERVSVGRRNGRLMALLPPSCTEPPNKEQPMEIFEQPRLYVNLNPLERETWKKLLKGQSIRDIARDEGVTRQAVYSRIAGNSQGQGGMVSKNFWVLLWWILRQRINSRENHDRNNLGVLDPSKTRRATRRTELNP